MTDESYGFSQARARLEEIVAQVRKKDTSLERSLDLLEEGVRLANQCTEQIDQASWEDVDSPVVDEGSLEASDPTEQGADATEDTEPGAVLSADEEADPGNDETPDALEDDEEPEPVRDGEDPADDSGRD